MKFTGRLARVLVCGALWCGSLVPPSLAADIGCGRDTDRSGTVDNMCPGDDTDFDGYTVAQGDCDDAEWQIFPGTLSTKGCSSGQFRSCKKDGSGYGSCTALSSLAASDITATYPGTALNVYWLAHDGTTGAGGGSYASPWDYRCLSQGASLTCSRSATAGDVYVFKAGTYTGTYSDSGTTRQLYIYNHSGTSTNPIYLIGDPTGAAIIAGQGSNPTGVNPIKIGLSDYIKIDNIEISGGYGGGMYVTEANYFQATRMIAQGADGNGGSDNLAGINASGSNMIIRNSLFYDNYNRAAPTNENNSQIVLFIGTSNTVSYNVLYTTRSGGAGYGFKYKHAASDGSFTFKGNYVSNVSGPGIQFGQPLGQIDHNLVTLATSCFDNRNGGGPTYYNNSIIEDNTCVNTLSLLVAAFNEPYAAIGTPALTVRRNVFSDNTSSYSCDGAGCVVNIVNYGSDAEYTDIITGGKFTTGAMVNNCYYNSNSAAIKTTVFGSNGGSGNYYDTWAAWTGAGYDAGSYNENPNMNALNQATSTNCSSRGYMTGTTTTTTSTTTTTTTPSAAGAGALARQRLYR